MIVADALAVARLIECARPTLSPVPEAQMLIWLMITEAGNGCLITCAALDVSLFRPVPLSVNLDGWRFVFANLPL